MAPTQHRLSWPERLPASGPVVLRPFREKDLGLVEELAADPYVPLIGTVPVPFTAESGRAYLARQHQRLVDGAGYSFAVADRDSDQALGTAGLWLTEREHGRCTAGYTVAPAARGRGIASAALAALTAFAWTHPDLHRITLWIEPWNAASVRVAQRCGYQREGLLRRYAVIGGERRDMLVYAALRPEPGGEAG